MHRQSSHEIGDGRRRRYLRVRSFHICQLYGSETGNCALSYMSTGGIFVGGSITSKIVSKMKEPTFMKAFLGEGRMQRAFGNDSRQDHSERRLGFDGSRAILPDPKGVWEGKSRGSVAKLTKRKAASKMHTAFSED